MSGRDLDVEKGGFPIYEDKNLPKVNAWRRAASMAGLKGVPILPRASVLFSTSESANDEPRCCQNCFMFFTSGKCQIHAPSLEIKKFTKGEKDGNPIEYWPVCGYWVHGEPSSDRPFYKASLDPDDTGLSWINAPRPGLELSGTNCGGINNGDDCDFYITDGATPKWESSTGFCRVLQTRVAAGDCCSAFQDDDLISWNVAQDWIKNG